MRPSNRGCRPFQDDRILGIGVRGHIGKLLSPGITSVNKSLPQSADGIMVSIPACNLSVRDFSNSVGFGTLAKINNFLAKRVILPFRQ